jgi:hypothetical protein
MKAFTKMGKKKDSDSMSGVTDPNTMGTGTIIKSKVSEFIAGWMVEYIEIHLYG